MKNLLKYLILVGIAVAFCNAGGGFDSSFENISSSFHLVGDLTHTDTFSAPDHALSAPRQLQLSGPTRLQCNSRRTSSMNKNSSEFVKSGKSFNIASLNSVRRHSLVVNTNVIEHAHKLVYLGKLII